MKAKKIKKTNSLEFVENEKFGCYLRRWPIFNLDDFLRFGGSVAALEKFISLLKQDANSTILISSTRIKDEEKVEQNGEYEPSSQSALLGRPCYAFSLGNRVVKIRKWDMQDKFPFWSWTSHCPAGCELNSAQITTCFGSEESLPIQIKRAEKKYEECRDTLGCARINGESQEAILALEQELECIKKYIDLITSIGTDGSFVSYEYSTSKKLDMSFCEKEALIIYIDLETKRPVSLESFMKELEKLVFMLKTEDAFSRGDFSVQDFSVYDSYVSLLLKSGELIRYHQIFGGCYLSESDQQIFHKVEELDWLFGDKFEFPGLENSFLLRTNLDGRCYHLKEELKGIRLFSFRSEKTKTAFFLKLKQAYYNIGLESLGERKIYNWNLLSLEEKNLQAKEIEERKKILAYGESIYNLICAAKNLGISPSVSRKIVRKFSHGKFVLSAVIEIMKLGLKVEDMVSVIEKFPEQGSKNKQLKALNIAAALLVLNGEYSGEVKKAFSEFLSIGWLF